MKVQINNKMVQVSIVSFVKSLRKVGSITISKNHKFQHRLALTKEKAPVGAGANNLNPDKS